MAIPHASDDLTRAALTGLFDPRALIPAGAEHEAERMAALADLAVERELDGRWYWTLTPDARRAGLARLPADSAAREAALAAVPHLQGDGLGTALRAALAARPSPDLRSLLDRGRVARGTLASPDDLDPNTLAQALELLEEADVPLPDWAAKPTTVRALRRAVVLDRRDRASHRLLPTPFRGRGRELRALEHYIRVGEAVDHAARPVMKEFPIDPDSTDIRAVIVSGIGGTGKSALIEALRRRSERTKGMTFLGFDLDQGSLRSGERVALTMELLRQIGLLRPELDQPLSAVRGVLRDMLSSVTDDSALLEVSSSAVYGALSELGGHLDAAGLKDHGFALVFDTFEQALVAGEERVRLISDWLMLLRDIAGIEKLRVILSGREADTIIALDIPGLSVVGQIELGDLGTNSGRAKLRDTFRRFDVAHIDLVPDLIAAFGSNPLVIEILAAFCRDRPRGEIIALAEDSDDDLRTDLDAEMRQRILYTRILNRIADRELRPLASPGLVLRRITPELIEQVLAEPCGLTLPLPPGKADALYAGLSGQVWLVRLAPSGDGLEHVPDLRRVMLPHILALPAATDVAREAAAWYARAAAGSPGPDFWESLYYRSLIDPDILDGREPPELLALADHLGAAVRDLPKKAQAMLREASGAILARDEIAALTGAARGRATQKRRARQVSEGLEQTVLREAMADEMADARLAEPPDAAAAPATSARGSAEKTDERLVVAAFAVADFERIAKAAPELALSLWDEAAGPDRVTDGDFDLTHPAWLASIATLAPDLPPAYHEALSQAAKYWAQKSGPDGRAETLAKALGDGTGPDGARARVASMVHALARAPNSPVAALEPALTAKTRRPGQTIYIDTTLDWRFEALLAPRPQPTDRPPVTFDLPAGELPMLHPNLLDPASRPRLVFRDTLKGAPAIEEAGLERFENGAALKLSDVTRALNVLDRVRVVLPLDNLPDVARRALIPGRLPEFHAPLRLLLDDTNPGRDLAEAVAAVTTHLPWWPQEIDPALFAQKTLGPTLIGTLIDLLDRAGMLPILAEELANKDGPDSRAARISNLIAAFCSFLRGDQS